MALVARSCCLPLLDVAVLAALWRCLRRPPTVGAVRSVDTLRNSIRFSFRLFFFFSRRRSVLVSFGVVLCSGALSRGLCSACAYERGFLSLRLWFGLAFALPSRHFPGGSSSLAWKYCFEFRFKLNLTCFLFPIASFTKPRKKFRAR